MRLRDDQYRSIGAVEDGARDGAEERASDGAEPTRSDDDQCGITRASKLDDLLGGVPPRISSSASTP